MRQSVPTRSVPRILASRLPQRKRSAAAPPAENAAVTRGILAGEITDARADICLMNAGAAIYIGGKADSIAEGIDTARRVIADGSALQKLEDFIRISQ